jgi:hypothetical protein
MQTAAYIQKVRAEEFGDGDGDDMVIMRRMRWARREQMVWVQGQTVSGEREVSVEQTQTQTGTQKRTFTSVHRRKKPKVKISLATIMEESFTFDEGGESGFHGESPPALESAVKDIPGDVEKWEICTATTVTIRIVAAVMIHIPKPRKRKDR